MLSRQTVYEVNLSGKLARFTVDQLALQVLERLKKDDENGVVEILGFELIDVIPEVVDKKSKLLAEFTLLEKVSTSTKTMSAEEK